MSFLEPSIESMLAAGQGKNEEKIRYQVYVIRMQRYRDIKLEFDCLAFRLLFNLNSFFDMSFTATTC